MSKSFAKSLATRKCLSVQLINICVKCKVKLSPVDFLTLKSFINWHLGKRVDSEWSIFHAKFTLLPGKQVITGGPLPFFMWIWRVKKHQKMTKKVQREGWAVLHQTCWEYFYILIVTHLSVSRHWGDFHNNMSTGCVHGQLTRLFLPKWFTQASILCELNKKGKDFYFPGIYFYSNMHLVAEEVQVTLCHLYLCVHFELGH